MGGGGPSPAHDVAVVDGATNQRSSAGADDGAERLPPTRSDDVAEHATGDAADDQARRAIVALAVVAVVRTPIDNVVSAHPSRTITAIVAPVIPRSIPIVLARFVAS